MTPTRRQWVFAVAGFLACFPLLQGLQAIAGELPTFQKIGFGALLGALTYQLERITR